MEKKQYGLFQEIYVSYYNYTSEISCISLTISDLLTDTEKENSTLRFSDGEIAKLIQKYLYSVLNSFLINWWAV